MSELFIAKVKKLEQKTTKEGANDSDTVYRVTAESDDGSGITLTLKRREMPFDFKVRGNVEVHIKEIKEN
jgi:hypothetical protein